MTPYADTALLCSLYAPDANTPRAVARVRRLTAPLPFHWLHQVELRNAFRLRVFRKEIDVSAQDASLRAVLADLSAGVLAPVDPAVHELLLETERLSAQHTGRLGTRSLDVMHVACALLVGATDFLGFDERQLALAKAAGLKTPKI